MRNAIGLALLIGCLCCLPHVGGGDSLDAATPVSSLSYPGHADEHDTAELVAAYPELVGTRLDDCQTCHTGGSVTYRRGGKASLYPCTYCHLLPMPDAEVLEGAPADYDATLNPFGRAYRDAGRNAAALHAIDDQDADGDGHANAVELRALRYPGDPLSRPGQPLVPSRTLSADRLRELELHSQYLLLNSTKQCFDDYSIYGGLRVKTLLESLGTDLSGATSLSFIAPDGFTWDCPVTQILNPFPRGRHYPRLDPQSFADPGQGFVRYPPAELIPSDLADGGEIPVDPWIMIALERNGGLLDASFLDLSSGHLEGEGPLRLIVPQSRPGAPDRGTSCSPSRYADGHDYDAAADHNAGYCVRGLVAVRVNPLPAGYEEFDWKNGGWAMIARGELLVYGSGITGD